MIEPSLKPLLPAHLPVGVLIVKLVASPFFTL